MKTTQEKIEIMQAYVDGKTIQFSTLFDDIPWQCFDTYPPSWNWAKYDYRIKQVSPLIIPWDAIKPEYKWAAKDENGQVYVYVEKPYLVKSMKWWEVRSDAGSWLGEHTMIKDPDNIDWKDSLIERPSA